MSGRGILVIEDEMVVQMHLARIVEELGHRVVGAASEAGQALEMARSDPPDLVLTDIRLANGSDGVDAARDLVSEFGCAVVFVSAYADDATVARTTEIGAAGYLVKPFTDNQVRAAITTAFASMSRERRGEVGDAIVTGETKNFGIGTRLLLYSHDTFGLGHLRRSLALISELSSRYPGISMLLVTGSPLVHRYQMPAGADYVKLPALQKVGAERYEARSLGIPSDSVRLLRTNLILRAARDYQPNVLLVDHSPTGSDGELFPTLEWLHQRGGCVRILGLRDVLDDPDVVKASWQAGGVYDTLARLYDHLVVYGNQAFYDPIAAYGIPPDVARKARFVDYVCAGEVAEQAFEPDIDDSDPPMVFVTIGGGDGGVETVILPFLAMMRQFADSIDFRAEIVTGPLVDSAERARIQTEAEGLPVLLHSFLPSTSAHMQRAELVVSTAGYNTITDLLSFARRSILIPRVLFRQEQIIRARRLDELGLVTCLHPEDATPVRLFAAIQAARSTEPLVDAREAGLPLAGAANFANFCGTLAVPVVTRA